MVVSKVQKENLGTYGSVLILVAVLFTSVYANFFFEPANSELSQLATFSSYAELKTFLETNIRQWGGFEGGLPQLLADSSLKVAPDYSTTNIQVAGVDEADVVKLDGKYLYIVSGSTIYIARAFPHEQARVVSKITLNETYSVEIYVHGDRLVVLGDRQRYFILEDAVRPSIAPYPNEAFVEVYDISDRGDPVVTRTVRLNGTISGSRMIGDFVYIVVIQPPILPLDGEKDFEVLLPTISANGSEETVQPTEIRYVNVPDSYYTFTTVVAVNILNDAQKPTHETFLTGTASSIYVSLSNMYLVVPKYAWIRGGGEETLIYRVALDGKKIVTVAQGAVSGYVLNQFSMDEYNGFFRIATTLWTEGGSVNNLYILNMNLSLVGELMDLAPGERIYSARFMGERCYLVTFRQIDPFFVIDVGKPTEPRVLGDLKIPGFSGYLHPYDVNHIIGVGMEESSAKLSLFDVTNVNNPREIAKYLVEGDWSNTPVTNDHKAFLFDKAKNLLALPVSINTYVEVKEEEPETWRYYTGYWQGAIMFHITEQGFTYRGNVTHRDETTQFEWGYDVKRILYIDNVLYTVSDKKVKLNTLDDLSLLTELELN
jgi:uncharacterized secreted protein with C-terminal beta-propeller domain